jgi:hypothetical protein
MFLTTYAVHGIILPMRWLVHVHEEFADEFDALDSEVKSELAAHVNLLALFGPALGRPRADTLKGSRFADMKELRFEACGGVWRVAFAFDPERKAVILVAGDKRGTNERRFYSKLISTADRRFAAHVATLKKRRTDT